MHSYTPIRFWQESAVVYSILKSVKTPFVFYIAATSTSFHSQKLTVAISCLESTQSEYSIKEQHYQRMRQTNKKSILAIQF
ncbi:uncharacterized protein PHALS_15290 [Plasmopara halstedii]|uniref:Uncharacterized protein n=1 Tax=Plasmopara halstedii TaxID=4781 RepID=A0A0P1ACB9_PLAHL|nr:uncharacterized protein PHALS_15290 [Plasmopara halstedii]CEG38134.1 hypothetical protein PHALS_15290 [Plasmopara halstedii]|eukprot:XP_024574503.1 hypothetical protein PHALS_15290 [Plasmopara halstedii]